MDNTIRSGSFDQGYLRISDPLRLIRSNITTIFFVVAVGGVATAYSFSPIFREMVQAHPIKSSVVTGLVLMSLGYKATTTSATNDEKLANYLGDRAFQFRLLSSGNEDARYIEKFYEKVISQFPSTAISRISIEEASSKALIMSLGEGEGKRCIKLDVYLRELPSSMTFARPAAGVNSTLLFRSPKIPKGGNFRQRGSICLFCIPGLAKDKVAKIAQELQRQARGQTDHPFWRQVQVCVVASSMTELSSDVTLTLLKLVCRAT